MSAQEQQQQENNLLNQIINQTEQFIKDKLAGNTKLLENDNINQLVVSSQDIVDTVLKENQKQIKQFNELRTLEDLYQHNNKIVKFQCMVQDVAESEVFPSFYISQDKKQIIQNIFIDNNQDQNSIKCINLSEGEQNNIVQLNEIQNFQQILLDKSVCHAIPIPNQNLLEKQVYQQNIQQYQEQNKQIKGQDINFYHKNEQIKINSQDNLEELQKKLQNTHIFNINPNEAPSQFPVIISMFNTSLPEDQQIKQKNTDNQEKKTNIYEPKLHDIIEVTGILNFEYVENQQVQDEIQDNQDDFDFSNGNGYHKQYPLCVIPRIQAIKVEEIKNLPRLEIKNLKNTIQTVDLINARNVLIEFLQEISLNDQLIANYLLMSLIGNTQFVKDGINYGKQIINLFNIPENSVKFVLKNNNQQTKMTFNLVLNIFLSLIMPHFQNINLSLNFLNKNKFSPNKNMETDQFEHGILQIPKELKPYLLVDETYLQQGQLESQGVQNVTYLTSLLDTQLLHVQNEYFKIQIPSNISGLILSQGRSFLYHDIKVNFENKISDKEIEISQGLQDLILNPLSEKNLNLIRNIQYYILSCREELPKVQLESNAQTAIQQDFINLRQKQQENKLQGEKLDNEELITQHTLEKWITFSKILAVSKNIHKKEGNNSEQKIGVEPEVYNEIRKLEEQRIKNLVNYNKLHPIKEQVHKKQ